MAWRVKSRGSRYVFLGLCALLFAVGIWQWSCFRAAPLLVAPMMNLAPCLLAGSNPAPGLGPDWLSRCSGAGASASHLIESTLQSLQAAADTSPNLQLGYTLQVPLLAMLKSEHGDWRVDSRAIAAVSRTILHTQRPLILYLFSTHFGVNAPIEPVLAGNPENLAQTPRGPLPVDQYYGQPIYPWSVARTDNPITRYRAQVIEELLQSLCQLPVVARERIRGITLLGEVHQMFPHFESGMGFGGNYQVSDYSATSSAGFRQYLQHRYADIGALNRRLGSDYASFDAVLPPSKDIRTETLQRYQEHMDAYAAGFLPITGWAYAPGTPSARTSVVIYLDGKPIGKAPVHLSRQDVRAARPEFDTADLGWRYDLDYRLLPPGIHRVDLALDRSGGPLIKLGSRSISIMDRRQSVPAISPSGELPSMQPMPSDIAAYVDEPRDGASYYFNPLAREWQDFREWQVAQYLRHFDAVVDASCLAGTARYTHQIVPQFNPGWDSGKFAVAASLKPAKSPHLGISLYGEASYGSSVADWLREGGVEVYGVTEFHPLKGMHEQELAEVLKEHRRRGARFLSFFLETRWQNRRVSELPNLFSFDPDNPKYASDQLFSSMRALLAH